jgi:hypothetical protein
VCDPIELFLSLNSYKSPKLSTNYYKVFSISLKNTLKSVLVEMGKGERKREEATREE